ncbi:NIPSNAP family protein [Paraburkholderia tropica]|uniref:NIPSNAP family protein n=1 Tax=Paraburkholderia tropica TaxID=92647 RepID=UPI00158FCC8B|nr:NIPSNAP family protein [Paraburkholderia tropica]
MIVEHRTYTLHPGNVPTYLDLYATEGMPIQLEYLSQPLGYYSTELGALNQVIHLWGYDDLDDRTKRRAAMKQDARWREYVRKILPLIQIQESKILIPAAFCRPQKAMFLAPPQVAA